jgi:glycogen debranching enzyme
MPDDIIQIEGKYYILATSSRTDDRPRVIKYGDEFAVFDRAGAITPAGLGEQGIYHDGTRYLSRFELTVEGRRLQPLRSTVRPDHALVVDLTNPDYTHLADPVERDAIHVLLTSFLYERGWYARIKVRNYALRPLQLTLTARFDADYADIFEVRGMARSRRGALRAPELAGDHLVLAYEGLDGVRRSTRLGFSPAPVALTATTATFALDLPPRGDDTVIDLNAVFRAREAGGPHPPEPDPVSFATALERSHAATASALAVEIESTNTRWTEWLDRSANDLRMMITHTPDGPYPYAGVPWFSTVFGRDGLITAFETLWLDPSIAGGVLAHLAATQSAVLDPVRDAEPGKIVHETRRGEMAALQEIPFGSYYGSVDATPLFVALAGAYWQRTADRAAVTRLWPHVERALAWIDEHGDPDRDGFVEYARKSKTGLASQGWKDSVDAVSHRDGTLAVGPVALCEVQGYVYAARRAAAVLARVLGHDDRARALDAQADELRERFAAAFWNDELGTYALALCGDKRACEVRTSNAGHCLFTGIATAAHAERVGETLLGRNLFSGWGIRTLDDREVRYNPMSYHNGSVWPHDNAIAAVGMARYGRKDRAAQVTSALFEASTSFDLHRMPELFCGFAKRDHDGPTPYPVACAPQAWAAGAVFMLLEACLGIEVDAVARHVRLHQPRLPDKVDGMKVRGLRVGDAVADLAFYRRDRQVGVEIERCDGDLQVIVVKR